MSDIQPGDLWCYDVGWTPYKVGNYDESMFIAVSVTSQFMGLIVISITADGVYTTESHWPYAQVVRVQNVSQEGKV